MRWSGECVGLGNALVWGMRWSVECVCVGNAEVWGMRKSVECAGVGNALVWGMRWSGECAGLGNALVWGMRWSGECAGLGNALVWGMRWSGGGETRCDALGQPQVRVPGGVDAVGRNEDPHALVRHPGKPSEPQPDVLRRPVFLSGVALAARRHDVFPGVSASPAAGHDVIDVLRGAAAVLALPVVPDEHRPARHRRPRPVGHLDEVVEPDDRGGGDLEL